MSILGSTRSLAPKATYAFAIPAPKDGEPLGVHVSVTHENGTPINFFLDVYSAAKLRGALDGSLQWIILNPSGVPISDEGGKP